jgi:hypothetical protein
VGNGCLSRSGSALRLEADRTPNSTPQISRRLAAPTAPVLISPALLLGIFARELGTGQCALKALLAVSSARLPRKLDLVMAKQGENAFVSSWQVVVVLLRLH